MRYNQISIEDRRDYIQRINEGYKTKPEHKKKIPLNINEGYHLKKLSEKPQSIYNTYQEEDGSITSSFSSDFFLSHKQFEGVYAKEENIFSFIPPIFTHLFFPSFRIDPFASLQPFIGGI